MSQNIMSMIVGITVSKKNCISEKTYIFKLELACRRPVVLQLILDNFITFYHCETCELTVTEAVSEITKKAINFQLETSFIKVLRKPLFDDNFRWVLLAFFHKTCYYML